MWVNANYMMLNQPKCCILIASHSPEQLWIQVDEQIIWVPKVEKLLGVNIKKGLNHVENICNKASAKVRALSRLIKIVSTNKKKKY